MRSRGLPARILAVVVWGALRSFTAGEDGPHHPSDFQGPESCARCHPRHYLEWRGSAHAYATVDPLFQACNRRALRETGGRIGAFCVNCHTPAGARTGEFREGFDPARVSPLGKAGVSCEICHRMEPPLEGKPIANASFELVEGAIFFGNLPEPRSTPAHEVAESAFIARSEFCGSCHDVIHNSALLEKSFAQWSGSAHNTVRADQCQDCHMLRYSGEAAVGGPFRETLRRHNFAAVSIPLVPFPNRGYQMEEVKRFLRTAARMDVFVPPSAQAGSDLYVTVRVKNSGAGHNLPTGLSNERQMWLEVTVTDEGGRAIFRSGHLDSRGDLRDQHGEDPGSDPLLITFTDRFLDDRGEEVPFVFLASRLEENSLKPLEERNATYRVPVTSPAGSRLRARVRLLFRSFPPHALRDLDLEHLARELPIWEMDAFESGPIEVAAALPRRSEYRVPGDFPSIQAAIDALADGDVVIAGPGEHVLEAPIDFRGKSIRVRSLEGPRNTVLRLARAKEGGTVPKAIEGSVVIFRGGEGPGAVLEGFTIRGGRGTEVGPARMGGAILIARSSPTIRGNHITESSAEGGFGGGICCDGGEPVIEGNIISDSSAELGGGIAFRAGSVRILRVRENRIEGNRARRGAGVHVEAGSAVRLERTILSGNVALDEGGAIHVAAGARLEFDRGTVVHNRAPASASIGGAAAPEARVTESILWMNKPPGGQGIFAYSIVESVESDPGEGSTNIRSYPLFVDPGGQYVRREEAAGPPSASPDTGNIGKWVPGDYRLLFGSPAIDAGDPDSPPDPDDTRADLGAVFVEQALNAFIRGDVDGDGRVEDSDLHTILGGLFAGLRLPCGDAADLDDDGRVTPVDAALLARFLLAGAPPPLPPHGSCGVDPTFGEGLSCERKAEPCLGYAESPPRKPRE